MKIITAMFAAALCAAFSGCATSTQKNAGAFLSKVAAMNITAADVTQTTKTPIYSHSESLAGLQKTEAGFSVANLKANFDIPLWGVTWSFSASSITGATPGAVAQVATAAGVSPEPTAK